LTASAATLPKGHFLIEPYVYDAITYGHYDDDGDERSAPRTHGFGSLTYINYGLTDRLTVGLIPTFGFNDVPGGADTSGLRLGDWSVQAQYRLAEFREGSRIPTLSFIVIQSLPTGRYDELGDRPGDGLGTGAYRTTLGLFSQYYFWLPNGRILRSRFNVSHSFSDDVSVRDVSVYGTEEGFRGRAKPGKGFSISWAGEYSITRNWVLALDLVYEREESTRVRGDVPVVPGSDVRRAFAANSGSSWRFGVVPAIEYNWSSRAGVIIGARWFAAGRNTSATITPVAAINLVY
jgi:hypothetical protein